MAEAAYATGPALLGAPRFSLLFLFLNFLFPVSARGPNSAPERGPKEPKSPRKLEAQKIDPKRFLFIPCFSVSARGPKEPKFPRKRYRPPKFKNGGPKCGASNDFFVPRFSAGSKQRGALKSPRPPKAKPQTKKTARPKKARLQKQACKPKIFYSFFGQVTPKSDRMQSQKIIGFRKFRNLKQTVTY